MLIKLIHSSVNQKEENITASVFTQPLTIHHIYDLYFKYIDPDTSNLELLIPDIFSILKASHPPPSKINQVVTLIMI